MRFLIGKLYMKNCGHCIELEPKWKLMRSNIDNQNKENNMGLDIEYIEEEADGIDSKLEKYNRQYFNGENKIQVQQGYPTIFFGVPEQKVNYYDGERTTDALENWYMDKMGIQKTAPIGARMVGPESPYESSPTNMGIIQLASFPNDSSVKIQKKKTKKHGHKKTRKTRKNRQKKQRSQKKANMK